MKKIYFLAVAVALAIAIVSCGSKKETKGEDYGDPKEEAVTTAPIDDITQGEALVKASDCKTCHHKVNKIIGPSHTDVAKKYEFTETNVKMLAEKIIKGGSGVWGTISMTAHLDIPQSDAEKMARYILSLDGEKEH